ncbi:hypothetical protein KO317_00160 [Candidatus Micrarchaeota archaeon]|jgi:hypothetical protein|nr:hypothetical protein [Candidatus Micrarchaeota archaeon]
MNDLNNKGFEEIVIEIQEYEQNLKKSKKINYEIEGIDLGKTIKTKITGLTFDQLITEVQKIEKMIAAKSYNTEMLSEISSIKDETIKEQFKEVIKPQQKRIKIEKKPLIKEAIAEKKDEKIEKISWEDQINKIDEINSMRDYILISYAREYIKELYDKFNSGEISPEEFRYETRKKMAINHGISEELIQERIKKEKNPFEELSQTDRG